MSTPPRKRPQPSVSSSDKGVVCDRMLAALGDEMALGRLQSDNRLNPDFCLALGNGCKKAFHELTGTGRENLLPMLPLIDINGGKGDKLAAVIDRFPKHLASAKKTLIRYSKTRTHSAELVKPHIEAVFNDYKIITEFLALFEPELEQTKLQVLKTKEKGKLVLAKKFADAANVLLETGLEELDKKIALGKENRGPGANR